MPRWSLPRPDDGLDLTARMTRVRVPHKSAVHHSLAAHVRAHDDHLPIAEFPMFDDTTTRAKAPVRSLGLDFGTTNSVAAITQPDGAVATATFSNAGTTEATCRSALGFSRAGTSGETRTEVGPWAVERYLTDPMDCRFLQSFKTFAASASFRSTIIHGRTYRYEDLMAAFLERMLALSDVALEPAARRLIIGRPVAYAGFAPDPKLAEQRYGAALAKCGIDEVHYVYEPVAAAFYYAQRLTHNATVLVADFGGGTSDFSIVRFEVGRSGLKAVPLAKTGVGLAGDRFDYRIIDHVVSPRLGKGSRYKSFDKMLDFPSHYFANFGAWNQLAIMKSAQTLRELRQLARVSDAPGQLEMLIRIIEEDLGYPLYKAVSEAKFALSHEQSARLCFDSEGIRIEATIEREEFERWIAPDLQQIDTAVAAALEQAGLQAGEIDKVFLTGGTSFVPALKKRFIDRFGAEQIETGDQLLSIAYGLALIGAQDDLTRWTVREN